MAGTKADSPFADAKSSEDMAVFQAAMTKNQVRAVEAPKVDVPKPVEKAADTRVPPEQVWKTRPRDESGKFVAKDEAAEEPDAPEIKAKNEPETVEAPRSEDQSEQGEVELEKARAALIRSGFRRKELDSMAPKEILRRGLQRARALDADDEAHLIARQFKSGQQVTQQGQNGSKAASTEPAPKPLDFKGVAKPLAEKLGLDGEEGVSALDEAFKGVVAPLVAELQTLKGDMAKATEAKQTALIEKTRKGLVGMFPQLAEPETSAQVMQEVRALADSKLYEGMDEESAYRAVFTDACERLRLDREEDPAARQAVRSEEKSERKYSRSSVSEKPKAFAGTPAEQDWAHFQTLKEKHGF